MLATSFAVLALAFFGHAPACGATPSLTVADLPKDNIGYADTKNCAITLDRALFKHKGRPCVVYLHEYYHLIGYYDPVGVQLPDGTVDHAHSPDPNNLMFPYLTPDEDVPWPCDWT